MTAPDRSEPITPGAALQDTALQEALRARAERRHWWSLSRRAVYDGAHLPVLRHLLGTFPWQVCDYRNGRWEWVERDLEVIFWHTWTRRYDTIQLLDHAGRPFAELDSPAPHSLRAPGGRLRFAGDPAVAIAYLPDGAPMDQVSLATTTSMKSWEAGELAMQLRPGQHGTPPAPPPSTSGRLSRWWNSATDHPTPDWARQDRLPHWLADHPAKPPRRQQPVPSSEDQR